MHMFIILFCLTILHRYTDGIFYRFFHPVQYHQIKNTTITTTTTEFPFDIYMEDEVMYVSLFDKFDKLDDTVKSFFLCF